MSPDCQNSLPDTDLTNAEAQAAELPFADQQQFAQRAHQHMLAKLAAKRGLRFVPPSRNTPEEQEMQDAIYRRIAREQHRKKMLAARVAQLKQAAERAAALAAIRQRLLAQLQTRTTPAAAAMARARRHRPARRTALRTSRPAARKKRHRGSSGDDPAAGGIGLRSVGGARWLHAARGDASTEDEDRAAVDWASQHVEPKRIAIPEGLRRQLEAQLSAPPPEPPPPTHNYPLVVATPRPDGLPAYYPAPTEDTATAKARQDAALLAHLMLARRLRALRREIQARAEEEIEFVNARIGPDKMLTPGEQATIKRRWHREIAAREGFGKKLPLPPRHMFTGAQGTGKTTLVRRFAGDHPDTYWLTEPTFEKSREEYEAYLREAGPDAPPAMLIRGLGRPDPKRPGHYMCDRHVAARHVANAGLSVPDLLCVNCQFSDRCGDHRQRREAEELVEAGIGAVFFLAANYAFLPAPAPEPAHAILDESLLQLAIELRDMPIDDIATITVPNTDFGSVDTSVTLRAIVEAFTTPHPTTPDRVAAGDERIMPRPLAYLRHAGVNAEALEYLDKSTRAQLEKWTPEISAAMSDAEIERALDNKMFRKLRQLLGLVSALRDEIDLPRESPTAVWEETLSGVPSLRIARLQKLCGLRHASLTILDGTGRADLARKLYGERLEVTEVRFDRKAFVTGTRGRSYSRQSITGEDRDGKPVSSRTASSARLRGEIAAIHGRMPTGSVVGGTKRAMESLIASGAIHPDTPVMTFAALRGRNTWEQSPGALLIGAENISLSDLEAMARAYIKGDSVPFVSMLGEVPKDWRYKNQWPFRVTRMRRMRDGSTASIEVPVHPDPRAQAVLELVREDELLQAFDRVRSVWHQRQITLLNDLCLDVTYDVIESHKHLAAGGNPLVRALLASGIVPHTPADLHAAHKAIFRSEAAAEHALRNYRLSAYKSPILDLAVVSYRRKGQRGPEAKLSLDLGRYPRMEDAIPAVQAAIGAKLQAFGGVPLLDEDEPPGLGAARRRAQWTPKPPPRGPGRGAAPPSIWLHGPPDD
jgi:hypothetical protein